MRSHRTRNVSELRDKLNTESNEIEVTPEMIEAGRDAWIAADNDFIEDRASLLERIFPAMLAVMKTRRG